MGGATDQHFLFVVLLQCNTNQMVLRVRRSLFDRSFCLMCPLQICWGELVFEFRIHGRLVYLCYILYRFRQGHTPFGDKIFLPHVSRLQGHLETLLSIKTLDHPKVTGSSFDRHMGTIFQSVTIREECTFSCVRGQSKCLLPRDEPTGHVSN